MPAGDDAQLVAIAEAIEGVLPSIPPPPTTPACQGCTPTATPVVVEFPANIWVSPDAAPVNVSMYELGLNGTCALKSAATFPIAPPTFAA